MILSASDELRREKAIHFTRSSFLKRPYRERWSFYSFGKPTEARSANDPYNWKWHACLFQLRGQVVGREPVRYEGIMHRCGLAEAAFLQKIVAEEWEIVWHKQRVKKYKK